MIKIGNKFLKYLRNNPIAIHCETQEEFDAMLKFFEKKKMTWEDGSIPTAREYYWVHSGARTCIQLDGKVLNYSPKDYYLKRGYTVLKFIGKDEAYISLLRSLKGIIYE